MVHDIVHVPCPTVPHSPFFNGASSGFSSPSCIFAWRIRTRKRSTSSFTVRSTSLSSSSCLFSFSTLSC